MCVCLSCVCVYCRKPSSRWAQVTRPPSPRLCPLSSSTSRALPPYWSSSSAPLRLACPPSECCTTWRYPHTPGTDLTQTCTHSHLTQTHTRMCAHTPHTPTDMYTRLQSHAPPLTHTYTCMHTHLSYISHTYDCARRSRHTFTHARTPIDICTLSYLQSHTHIPVDICTHAHTPTIATRLTHPRTYTHIPHRHLAHLSLAHTSHSHSHTHSSRVSQNHHHHSNPCYCISPFRF